jgi:hypothetical protein
MSSNPVHVLAKKIDKDHKSVTRQS